jgi:hypothetical protein
LDISVGDGKQTFKWLASVIQSRIQTHQLRRKGYETESYIVTELLNTKGELLNPSHCIYEHAGSNGMELSAVLATSFPVDEWDNPEMGDFMKE